MTDAYRVYTRPGKGASRRALAVWQKPVHPSALGLKCTERMVRCEYAERIGGGHTFKCGWFGHETTKPHERPRCCRFATSPIPRKVDYDALER